MSFHRVSGSLGDQRLCGMEAREIGGAARRFVEIDVTQDVGFAEQSMSFGEKVSGFGRQNSIPSRRISRISGVRSLYEPAR